MSSAICTLFEGDYHLGVAALVNSLHAAGYRDVIWVGFRGSLPSWVPPVIAAEKEPALVLGSGMTLRFVRLETEAHFTNYKPQFLSQLLDNVIPASVERLFYFDPDIVVQARWSFFEEWADSGVALAEDVNSPLPENHPRRVGWRKKLAVADLHLRYRQPAYVNGGFIGFRREHRFFIELWQRVLTWIIESEGGDRGWQHTSLSGGRMSDSHGAFSQVFSLTDQDALNAATELCPGVSLSIIGQEAMGFKTGGYIMHHALGRWKPWRRRYLREAFGGHPPATVDKEFWRWLDVGPIKPVPEMLVKRRNIELKLAAAVGRFIRRA